MALAALLPLLAAAYGRRRLAAARRELALQPPRRAGMLRLAAAVCGSALLGLAAAQPALTHASGTRVRPDVEALFVLDTSRSMAAAAALHAPTRLDRAVAAAERLRAAIPEVPSGIATLTDRVLPDLLPVADTAGFDAVAGRAVAIESPPPQSSAVRATSYEALAGIASGDYFPRSARRRLVVLLSDGESAPFDAAAVARALAPGRGYRFEAVRFWRSGEAVYDPAGRPESAYRPDPLGRVLVDQLAAAAGGKAFEEGEVAAAAAYLRGLAGGGPTVVAGGLARSRRPLAPYVAAAALVLLLAALAPAAPRNRRLQSLPS